MVAADSKVTWPSLSWAYPLIADEVQSGTGRTGKMLSEVANG